MAEKHLYMKDLHFEHLVWISELAFCKDELKILEEKLREVALKNTTMEAKAHVEHFQNQFIRQDEASDELLHDLRAAEHVFSEISKTNPAASHVLFDDHVELRDKATTHKTIFEDLRHEFQLFLAKYM